MLFERFLGLVICLTHPAKFRSLKSHPSDQFFNRYSKKVQIMQSDTIVTATPGDWRHSDDYPPPRLKLALFNKRNEMAKSKDRTGERHVKLVCLEMCLKS